MESRISEDAQVNDELYASIGSSLYDRLAQTVPPPASRSVRRLQRLLGFMPADPQSPRHGMHQAGNSVVATLKIGTSGGHSATTPELWNAVLAA
ncbi:MAG TPA: hypothetical protein VK638_41915 [Edaphobacter sp.]|nr:hypothetical protein [Edaphobacter sp.]